MDEEREQPEAVRREAHLIDGCGFSAEEIAAAPEVELEERDPGFDPEQPFTIRRPLAVFDWLDDRLEKRGIDVAYVKGWRQRTAGGDLDPVGAMFHHTGSAATSGRAPCKGIVTFGRPDLDGPLCNLLVSRPNDKDRIKVFFIAAGVANHAGIGGPMFGIPENAGNPRLIGVEVENDGRGEDWPRSQRQALHDLFALLLFRIHQPGKLCIAHKEWTTRKIDPAGIDMDVFRSNVRRELRALRR